MYINQVMMFDISVSLMGMNLHQKLQEMVVSWIKLFLFSKSIIGLLEYWTIHVC